MDNITAIIGIILIMVTVIAAVVLVYELVMNSNKPKKIPRNLMMSGNLGEDSSLIDNETLKEIEKNVELTAKAKEIQKADELDVKFFQAGYFGSSEKDNYFKQKKQLPFIFAGSAFVLGLLTGVPLMLTLVVCFVGAYYGYKRPDFKLDNSIERRQEEIMFYLPLVVEQISIGVSSSLDVGPCIAKIVEMADDRDSHNPVTELLKFAEHYIRSGSSFEEAMTDVAKRSGNMEVKHVFLSLASVAKHGGEISKQLQELGDTAYAKRENQVEARIAKLTLKSSLPVSIVFVGFMLILLSGIGSSLLKGLKDAGL